MEAKGTAANESEVTIGKVALKRYFDEEAAASKSAAAELKTE